MTQYRTLGPCDCSTKVDHPLPRFEWETWVEEEKSKQIKTNRSSITGHVVYLDDNMTICLLSVVSSDNKPSDSWQFIQAHFDIL